MRQQLGICYSSFPGTIFAFYVNLGYYLKGMVSRTPIRAFWARLPVFLRTALATAPVLAITAYLYLESRNSERLLLEAETARQADSTLLQFQGFIESRVDALKDAGNFVVNSSGGEGEDFNRFARHLFTDVPYLDSIAQFDAGGGLVRDLRSNPAPAPGNAPLPPPAVFGPALAKVLSSRQPVASGTFELPGGEEGVAVIVPIMREKSLEGALAGTVRLKAAVRDMYSAEVPSLWNLQLADRSGRVFYRSASADPSPSGLVATRHIPVADRAWKLHLWPTPALVATLRTAAPQRILVIGLLATLVVAAANYLLARHGDRLAESLRETKHLALDRDRARRQLSELVNGIEAVVWESDAQRERVTFVNDYARRLLGLDTARWVADADFWWEHVHPDDRAKARENVRAARQPGQTCAAEYRMMDADDHVIWVREIVTVIGGDRVRGLRGVVVDISARVQAEEALRQSQKLESLGVLAGGIAHDFNNLLTTIMGNAEMLRPWLAGGDAKGRGHLDKIERTTRRLAELTRQMLAYSGRGEFTVAELDLNAIVTEMTDLLAVTTPKNVEVIYHLDSDLPLIRADAAQMRQVILNLLTNATEAIGEHRRGEVVIRTDVATLDAEQLQENFAGQEIEPGLFVTLEVSDTGSGMSAETLSKIFDPFFTTKFTGRGLGLAALRGIIRSHRGGIRIFSRLGEGTVFTLLFPAVGGNVVRPSAEKKRLEDAAGLAGATILLVDDEESLRSLMAMALEDAGSAVIQAVDGEDGIAQFRSHRADIDLVVLDLTMPRLNGDEVFRQIMDTQPDTKVILISGYTQEDVARHFTGHRVTGYLEKPFPPSELVAKIRSVLRESNDGGTTPSTPPTAPPAAKNPAATHRRRDGDGPRR